MAFDPGSPHRPPRKLHPRLWIAFLAVTGAAIGFSTWQQWVLEQRYQASLERQIALEHKANALRSRVGMQRSIALMLDPPWRQPDPPVAQQLYRNMLRSLDRIRQNWAPSQRDVEQVLGVQLSCRSTPQGHTACGYRDSEGVPFVISFSAGRLRDVMLAPEAVPDVTYPLDPPAWQEARQYLRDHDLWGCLVLLLLVIVWRSCRVLLAELLVMLCLVRILTRFKPIGSYMSWSDYWDAPFLPWAVCVLCAGLTVLAWAYFGAQARSRVRCPVCDYNLTGNSSQRCPECGNVINPATRALVQTLITPPASS